MSNLTWPALLAKWTQFAQASAAFPKSGPGSLWRASVPAVIGLQAVTMALGELTALQAAEQAVGLARAGAAIQKYERELLALWGSDLSPELGALIGDARRAFDAASE
jgi:hypothetical protein